MAYVSGSVDEWARRILSYDGESEHQQLLDDLRADQDRAAGLLDRLSEFPDPIVRAWAGTASKEVFGHDAVPLLTRLVKDRDPDVRDVARQDLVAIDPDFEDTFFPAYRRALKRRKDPWGEDQAAMFHLARARDAEAVPLLREYASHHEPRYWHNRMPLVLADYIEDPASVLRRIRAHDHDFMLWLVDAAAILDLPDPEEALRTARDSSIDEACATLIDQRLRLRSIASSSRDMPER